MTANDYFLGHSELEHRRLMIQSRFLRSSTIRFLRSAGVGDGMSVLDIGSGLGDVSLVTAELVGPSGEVLGVERDPRAVETAKHRAESEGCADHVTFVESSLDDFDTDTRFDALVGRFVLQYQPDPAAVLRRFAGFVRPGGVVVMHDMDFSDTNVSYPVCREWNDSYALLDKLFRATGFPSDFGRQLTRVFRDAGLPWPEVEAIGTTGGKPGSAVFSWLAACIRAIEPVLVREGVELPSGVKIDESLATTLERAVLDQNSQVMGSMQYGAWIRKV